MLEWVPVHELAFTDHFCLQQQRLVARKACPLALPCLAVLPVDNETRTDYHLACCGHPKSTQATLCGYLCPTLVSRGIPGSDNRSTVVSHIQPAREEDRAQSVMASLPPIAREGGSLYMDSSPHKTSIFLLPVCHVRIITHGQAAALTILSPKPKTRATWRSASLSNTPSASISTQHQPLASLRPRTSTDLPGPYSHRTRDSSTVLRGRQRCALS